MPSDQLSMKTSGRLGSKRNRLNVLVSYAYLQKDQYLKDIVAAIAPYTNILIDSGAWSNFQNRIKKPTDTKFSVPVVTLEAYIDYCRSVHGLVWEYVSLDVYRDRKGTDHNLQAMVEAGLKPMPVYIEGYHEDDLARILKINLRISVAGGVGANDSYIKKRYKDIYELSGQKALIHALGYGRYPGIFEIPVSSSDSSSYSTGGQFGNLMIYNPGGWIKLHWKDLYKPNPLQKLFLDELYKMGVRPAQVVDTDLYHHSPYSIQSFFSTYAYLNFMDHIADHGKLYFFSTTSTDWLLIILVCLACENEWGVDLLRAIRWGKELRLLRKERGIAPVLDELIPAIKNRTQWEKTNG